MRDIKKEVGMINYDFFDLNTPYNETFGLLDF